MNLKDHFPRASKSFIEANAPLSSPSEPQQNDSRTIVAPRRGKMNKVEAEYAMILEAMKRKGEILRYEFEGITLRFAGVKYTPDFVVLARSSTEEQALYKRQVDGSIPSAPILKFIEIKGPFIKGNRERAVERFRHAKTYWPEFTFELHQKTKDGQWRQII